MPYLNPAVKTAPTAVPQHTPTPSPVVAAIGPLPVHSHGRPGHRRSFSYTPADTPPTGAFTPLASLPRRKPASFHLAEDDDDSSPEDGSPPKEPAPIASPLPPTTNNGRQSRSSSLSSLHGPPAAARFAAGASGLKPTPAGKPTNLNTDDEDDGRGLPPLKLRIPGLGGFGQAGSGANSPRGVNSPRGSSSNLVGLGSPVPFPTSSKNGSPPRSRTSSGPVDVRITAATPSSAAAAAAAAANVGTPGTDSPRPSFSRTSSSPMILANGKPLKSSLKSSSSSPNIPFPSQSILPSRLYAEIAQAQRQREQQDALLPNQRHARAASAPNLPNFDVSSLRPRDGAATPTQDSSPYEEEEDEAETPGYEIYGNAHTAPSTPSAPKAVHFPSSEEGGLTTIRVFKRTAKPVNLLLPGASGGEETETETDGEGYNSSGTGANGAGYHYGIHNTWGFSTSSNSAGYQNPWDRYTRQNQTAANTAANRVGGGAGSGAGAGGYPFPSMQMGGRMVVPTRQSPYQHHLHQGQHAFTPPVRAPPTTTTTPKAQPPPPASAPAPAAPKMIKEKKRILYELDATTTSTVPKRDLAMFDNVFLESVDLKCSKRPLDGSNQPSEVESSEDDDEEGKEGGGGVRVSPKLNCILEGTLLVRNVAYEKHVSVRFTLDDWHTTSEVKASYKESLGSLPDAWRNWVLGDRTSSTPSSPLSSSKPLPAAPPAGPSPQWDRFTFSINLSDYARGRSLSSRTLWLVARFAVPGDVRVPVPKLLPGFNFSSPSTSVNPPKSGGGEDERWESELLRRCERDMVDLLIRGLGPSTPSNSAGGEHVVPVRQRVDVELRKRQIGVGSCGGCEWWDNNASGNYRIGFREREVVVERPFTVSPQSQSQSQSGEEERKVEEPPEVGLPPLAQRRKNVLSCPPAFTNAPPTSINAYSALSPPQLSSSNSADSTTSSSNQLQPHHRSTSSGSLPSTSPSTPLPTSYSTGNLGALAASGGGGSLATGALPNTSGRRAETTKAMAETTLERLKRLNLRNYAAPGMSAGHVRAVSSPGVMSTEAPATKAKEPSPLATPQEMERTSSNPLPLGTPTPVVLPPPTPDSIQPSHSQESSTSSKEGASSEAGTNDSTPLTSPLHTPTMGAVDIPSAVRVRGTGSEEASPSSEGAAAAAAAMGNWRSSAAASSGEKKEETTPKEEGLRPLLSRNSTVVSPPATAESEENGAKTPTVSSSGLSIPIPVRSPDASTFEPRSTDLLSPLLEPMMSGAPSFGMMGGGAMELGTSPPFSSLGEGSFGGRSLSSTNLNLNHLPDFGSSVVTQAQPSLTNSTTTTTSNKRGPVPVPLNLTSLKPKQIGILEGIREKSTSSPPRSPSGSGRNSPAPLLLPRSFSGSSLTDPQSTPSVVNRVEGITGSVKPPVVGMTPLSSLRDSMTPASLLDTPKPSTGASSTATLTPASGRRVVSAEGALGGSDKRTTTSPATSGSESNASNGSKSGSGSSGSKKSNGAQKRAGARSPPPRGGHLGLMFATQQGGTKSPGSSPLGPPMSPSSLAGEGVGDDIRDPDSIYQAFVKQWCFASAPSPAQGGGFGRKGV